MAVAVVAPHPPVAAAAATLPKYEELIPPREAQYFIEKKAQIIIEAGQSRRRCFIQSGTWIRNEVQSVKTCADMWMPGWTGYHVHPSFQPRSQIICGYFSARAPRDSASGPMVARQKQPPLCWTRVCKIHN